ncbi:ATP-binding protein [Candidatus Micrarchaeota archaeon]|nr:ATP-binding protein [Candidatus Micrarchaeota archaeon]
MPDLGTIVVTEESPSTIQFSFVIKNKDVRKGQFVQVSGHENETIFGFVSEILKANRYFERADSVADFQLSQGGISNNFPTSSWEYMLAEVKILGAFRNKRFSRVFVPPSPGQNVLLADGDILKTFLGFEDSGLHLGQIEHHAVDAKISMTRLLQKHLAILAMSGAGKSHLSSVILEELLMRKKEDGRVAIVVVDIHGEYIGFVHDPVFGSKTSIIDGNDICVPLRKISPETIMEWVPDLSSPQRDLLRHALAALKTTKKSDGFSFKELISAIDVSDVTKDEVKRALKRTITELRRYKFLSTKSEKPKLVSEIAPGKLTILDFSSIDSLRKKQILVSMIARRLFSLRKKNKIPPFLLLIEEAHNFAREKAEERETVSRSIIETIAREGRKFGASLCLISQRPVNLSTTALSQCNTHIILRVTNPNDLDHIQMSSEGIDARVAKSITGLKVGEAILVGEAVNSPIFIQVRDRKSTKRERGAPLHKQAVEFEESREKKEKGVEAFI